MRIAVVSDIRGNLPALEAVLAGIAREGVALAANPGSVGLPAFDDTHPHPHVVETGSPHARR
jgi:hypothetical protein